MTNPLNELSINEPKVMGLTQTILVNSLTLLRIVLVVESTGAGVISVGHTGIRPVGLGGIIYFAIADKKLTDMLKPKILMTV